MMKKFLAAFLALCSLAAADPGRKIVGVIKYDCPSNSTIYVSIPLKSRNATDTWRFGDMSLKDQLIKGSTIYVPSGVSWASFSKSSLSGWLTRALNQEFDRKGFGTMGINSRTNQMVFIAGYVPTEETTTVHLYPTNNNTQDTRFHYYNYIVAPPYPADITSFVDSELAEQVPDMGKVYFYEGSEWQEYIKDPEGDDPWSPGAHEKSLPAGTVASVAVSNDCDIIWQRPYQLGE